MPNVRLPLSGDVMQSINPWSWTFNTLGSQFGLVNVNLGYSPAPKLEEQILNDVGSYGRQLGRIGEALEVLLKKLDRKQLDDEEKKALWAFEQQMDEIRAAKKAYRSGSA